jgi:hypothetical protein
MFPAIRIALKRLLSDKRGNLILPEDSLSKAACIGACAVASVALGDQVATRLTDTGEAGNTVQAGLAAPISAPVTRTAKVEKPWTAGGR